MKIVINTEDSELYANFLSYAKENEIEVITAKSEVILFDTINKNQGDAYVISDSFPFAIKAIDNIKKMNPFVPIVFIRNEETKKISPKNADIVIYMPVKVSYDNFIVSIMHNINMYIRNFNVVHKLTCKIKEKISFGECVYDPTRRILYHRNKEVKRLSIKEGGIVEILAVNFGQVVKKEIILEKVWRKSDYFAGRSMDVYITYIRNIFKEHNINLSIKNISGIGLILE